MTEDAMRSFIVYVFFFSGDYGKMRMRGNTEISNHLECLSMEYMAAIAYEDVSGNPRLCLN